MKQLVLIMLFLLLPFMETNAAITPICMQPKEDIEISRTIKRAPIWVPTIGTDGTTLVRLQPATTTNYKVEILQKSEIVFATMWNFQDERLQLPNDLIGMFNIRLSDGSRTFVGTFSIE